MRRLRAWLVRLRGLFNKQSRDRELAEELESHLQMHIQDNLRAGMPPGQARREALIKLGGLDSTKEAYRDQRSFPGLESLLQDLRYGTRMLLKNPVFTIVAMSTLALGIGANTAIFSLVNALLFRPLPFREPDRLVWITNPNLGGEGIPGMIGAANLRDWRQLNQSFEDLGAYVPSFSERLTATLTGHGEPDRLKNIFVTGNFLKVLGVQPQLGRGFLDEECQRNGPKAVILTDSFWRRRFQADPNIIGRAITINDVSRSVVGVLPASFDFSSIFTPGARTVDLVRPFPNIPGYDNSGNIMAVVGWLKPGVTLAKAQAELDQLNQQLQMAHPERGKFGARLSPLREHVSGQFRRPFLVLSGAVGCVLLIACANLSNLLLARAAARRKEIALRIALGAGRWRLIRQMLTESTLLACCGAALGLPLAYAATHALAQVHTFNIPLLRTARVDGVALSFTLAIALSTGFLMGIIPALQLSRADIQGDLKDAGRGSGHSRRRVWMRGCLAVSEMAMACLLLVVAGLLMRSFVRLLDIDPGFKPEQAAAWRIESGRPFATNTEEIVFFTELLHRVESIPGVQSASYTDKLPMDLNDVLSVRAQGESYRDGEVPSAYARFVTQGYFKTMGIPLRDGRDFDLHDKAFEWRAPVENEKVAIVNEKLAHNLWPGKDALGQTVLMDGRPDPTAACRVIGVVGNVRSSALEQEGGPEIYVLGHPGSGGELVVRTQATLASLVPAVRAVLRQMDPNMSADEFKPLNQIVDRAVSPKRLITLLLGLFSLVALLLASVGIYGVIAYSVSQRTQEIGIRLALGSPTAAVLRLVIHEGMMLALLGCALGLAASLALTRVIQSLLFGVSSADPLTFLASGLLLLTVALLACWLPARRAARVDPMTALRA